MIAAFPLTSDERRTALANIAARREQIAAQLQALNTEMAQMDTIEAEHLHLLGQGGHAGQEARGGAQ